jgi:2-polyprenyl-3-methyl-5-hydroxy-6-metoxy-1,4-benzoquinol methylase
MNTLENTSELHRAEAPTTKTIAQAESCPVCSGGQVAEFLVAPDRYHWRKQTYRLARCSSCESVWLSSPPQPQEMGLHYTEDYHRAIVAAGEGSAVERWKDQVKLISDFKREGSILDIGCSSGGFLSTMKNGAWQLYGIEMEESTAVRARANTGAEVFVGDAMDAPFPSGSFDVITCFDVLEHVYSPREFLTKVLSWLKPGGIFYSMMPNIASWEARVFGTHWYGLELPRHLFHFSPGSLRHLMREIGFTEEVVKTPAISYVEHSTEYVCSSLIEKMGIEPRPQAKPKPASLPWKVVRKGIRLSVIRPLAHIASSAGAGPCMEVVFRKPQPIRSV